MIKNNGAITVPGFGYEPLTIEGIAMRLGRELRFGRGVRCWWTVLHHTFVVETICMDILQDKRKSYRDSVRIYALLHDAHESIWGDIPTPLKTAEIRLMQGDFDRQLYKMLELPEPPASYKEVIKKADHRALLAEGATVGPRGWYRHYRETNPDKVGYEVDRYHRADCEVVASIYETYPAANYTFAAHSPGVVELLRTFGEALRGSHEEEDRVAA